MRASRRPASLLAFAEHRDHLLVQKTLYGGTQSFLDQDLPRLGLSYTAIDTTDPEGPKAWEKALTPAAKLILVETISNPLMEVGDLRSVVTFAREHDLVTVQPAADVLAVRRRSEIL